MLSQPLTESLAVAAAQSSYQVVSVISGDTFLVSIGGQDTSVRVIGIEAPETGECWDGEASDAASELLIGGSVQLVADSTQADKDQSDHLLRYVLLADGTDFGLTMINGGDAYEYTSDAPYENQGKYRSAQAAATANRAGLWSAGGCNGQRTMPAPATVLESSVPVPEVAPPVTGLSTVETTLGACDIKGNINSDGVKIYRFRESTAAPSSGRCRSRVSSAGLVGSPSMRRPWRASSTKKAEPAATAPRGRIVRTRH